MLPAFADALADRHDSASPGFLALGKQLDAHAEAEAMLLEMQHARQDIPDVDGDQPPSFVMNLFTGMLEEVEPSQGKDPSFDDFLQALISPETQDRDAPSLAQEQARGRHMKRQAQRLLELVTVLEVMQRRQPLQAQLQSEQGVEANRLSAAQAAIAPRPETRTPPQDRMAASDPTPRLAAMRAQEALQQYHAAAPERAVQALREGLQSQAVRQAAQRAQELVREPAGKAAYEQTLQVVRQVTAARAAESMARQEMLQTTRIAGEALRDVQIAAQRQQSVLTSAEQSRALETVQLAVRQNFEQWHRLHGQLQQGQTGPVMQEAVRQQLAHTERAMHRQAEAAAAMPAVQEKLSLAAAQMKELSASAQQTASQALPAPMGAAKAPEPSMRTTLQDAPQNVIDFQQWQKAFAASSHPAASQEAMVHSEVSQPKPPQASSLPDSDKEVLGKHSTYASQGRDPLSDALPARDAFLHDVPLKRSALLPERGDKASPAAYVPLSDDPISRTSHVCGPGCTHHHHAPPPVYEAVSKGKDPLADVVCTVCGGKGHQCAPPSKNPSQVSVQETIQALRNQSTSIRL